jgi:Concanavalin A-like lectin/glucanases superfamily
MRHLSFVLQFHGSVAPVAGSSQALQAQTTAVNQSFRRSLLRVLVLLTTVALVPEYIQADVREGLIAEYRFDESVGHIAADSSGHHLDGRLEGHPQWVKGYYGNGLQFDGASDYVYVGNQAAFDVTQYTLTAWINTDGRTRDPERQEILEKAGAYWLNIRNDSHMLRAGGFFGGCRGTPYWTYLDTATSIPLRTWTHVASTYNGTSLTIFLNGVLSVHQTEVRPPCTTNRRLLILGAKKAEEDAPAEAFFSGILDEVRIYSRALSQAEIQEVMRASRE